MNMCVFDHEMLSEEKEEEKKLQPTHEKKAMLKIFFTTLLPITPHSYNGK